MVSLTVISLPGLLVYPPGFCAWNWEMPSDSRSTQPGKTGIIELAFFVVREKNVNPMEFNHLARKNTNHF